MTAASATPVLAVDDLTKRFRARRGVVQAFERVSFAIAPGETLGLVGESGCGKTSLAKTVFRLLEPDEGQILLDGIDISHVSRRTLRPQRERMQMVFQDPYGSLNPRSRVGRILEEPLIVHGRGTRAVRRERVRWLIQRVGLSEDALQRYPHEFSGGQRQRIGIARALALTPRLLICDEPVSALDVSIQAQILNLLAEIKQAFGLAYLFISHDLAVVRLVADRVMVMYLGRIVEVAESAALWARPMHPYTRALMSAAPVPDPDAGGEGRILLDGDPPSPFDPPPGCRFHTRCRYATEICRTAQPPLRRIGTTASWIACHHVHGDHLESLQIPS